MLSSKMNWKIRKSEVDDSVSREIIQATGLSEKFVVLCMQRGLETKEQIKAFIDGAEMEFHDPYLLHDMDKAIHRLMEAIEAGEEIVVYGDYDADGITSTSILVETIEVLGGNVGYYLPNRFTDGYGPNAAAFKKLIENGAQLILTCDNGVSGQEPIAMAKKMGVDVIVSDHHELPDALPDAYAIIHPKHPAGSYPFPDLSGAGVALKIAAALLGEMPYESLDLAAIGTVADLVSLTGENRWIVKQGLQVMKQTHRLGLAALMESAGIDVANLDEESIGFIIGPRLNAVGRLEDAGPGAELMLSFDEEKIAELVAYIQEKNVERQGIVQSIHEEASAELAKNESLPDVVVLGNKNWHEGVLGIVASKLVEEFGRPTILFRIDEKTGIAKGSARSTEALDIYTALNDSKDLLTKFGGHKMAAGMSLPAADLSAFSEKINSYAALYHDAIVLGESIYIDAMLPLGDVTLPFLKELELLKPYGTDNPKPIFGFQNVPLTDIRQIGADNKHLKFKLKDKNLFLDVIGFNKGSISNHLNEADVVSLIGELSINVWRDSAKPQLQLKDIKNKHVQFFDKRSSIIQESVLAVEDALYLFSTSGIMKQYYERIPNSSNAALLTDNTADALQDVSASNLVLFECPLKMDLLADLLKSNQFENVYVVSHETNSVYADGVPPKDQFAKFYQYIRSHKDIDVRNRLDALAKYLKIKKNLAIFMIQVFLEAGFVTIDNGFINEVQNPVKRALDDTQVYKDRLQKMEAEKVFIYSPFSQLTKWLNEQMMVQ
ncbi:single-stranded-DNA-specific exonuclease RecJ [Trichococcus sp.]|uniref:single-stranded-DNA-specific exonuclease RecJ n=1 Tax=Trichococcus sp. TaxID=1985464 RepID=UPI003C7A58BD